MKRLIGPVLTLLLILGVGAALYVSVGQQLAARQMVKVRGLIGSEKEAFFLDPRVQEALRKQGLEVQIEKAGSRQIATSFDLSKYDFVFPAGIPAAEKLKREQKDRITGSYDVFFTPMTIASWRNIAEVLKANKMVREENGYYLVIDMKKLIDTIAAGTRWKELPSNTAYAVDKSVLVSSTDIRTSNSAAMYLALASYIANGNSVVQNQTEATKVNDLMSSLFLRQGFTAASTETPFEDYMVMGPGKAPLVMIYEAQFLAQAATPNSGVRSDMVLLYPEPTLFTKHILLSTSEQGKRLGDALSRDPELQKLAVEHGFRNANTAYFEEFTKSHKVAVPATLVNVVEPPSYEILEHMIQQIEQKYTNGG